MLDDGRMEPLSLRDTLVQAHTIREIYTDSPLTVAALHRLLLAVLHRVFRPMNRHVWAELWVKGQGQWKPTTLDEYLIGKSDERRTKAAVQCLE
jgi:CRISPR system Cascade subunit CasA